MRTALIVWLIVIFGVSAPKAATANPVDHLKTTLSTFAADSLLRPVLQPALDRLPEWCRLIQQADSLCRQSDIQADFIAQWHLTMSDTPYDKKQTRLSQKRVRQLLDSLDYSVVGHEGWVHRPITCDTLRALFHQIYRDKGLNPDSWRVEDSVMECRQYDGVFDWMCRSGEHYVIGTEDQVLIDLQEHFYYPQPDVWPRLMARGDEAFLDFNQTVRQIRTEVMLATLIIELDRRGSQRGVVVMGFAHYPEWAEAVQRYSIRSDYYPTLDLSQGQVEEAARIRNLLNPGNRD